MFTDWFMAIGDVAAGNTHWYWWALGVGLVILEILLPGVFLLWLGTAACLVGAILLISPVLNWEWQLLLFAALSIILVLLQVFWFKQYPIQSDNPTLNRRGRQYIGRIFTLEAPIVDEIGEIKVDDSIWKIKGGAYKAGTKIVVTGLDGNMLVVKKVKQLL